MPVNERRSSWHDRRMDRGGFLKRAGLALGLLAAPPQILGVIAELEPEDVAAAEPAGEVGYYGLVTAGGLCTPLYLKDVPLPRFNAWAGGVKWPRP